MKIEYRNTCLVHVNVNYNFNYKTFSGFLRSFCEEDKNLIYQPEYRKPNAMAQTILIEPWYARLSNGPYIETQTR